MKSAYNEIWLHNLEIVKEVKPWCKKNLISREQQEAIIAEYRSGFYHPNIIIRILLFIASLIALLGVTGLLSLITEELWNEKWLSVMCFFYGALSVMVLEKVFIQNNHHYKSGVTEALLYHSLLFIIVGCGGVVDFNEHALLIICLLFFSASAVRYLDLISTGAAFCVLVYLIFFEMYEGGGLFRQLIPFTFIIIFSLLYVYFKKLSNSEHTDPWKNVLLLSKAISLVVIYAAGNYFVVRELSVELMDLQLAEGEDIPFAFFFYFLTVFIPLLYLYIGIKNKNVVLLRVSLFAIAFSAFTFKYYFSLNRPEITLTVAGIILIAVAISLLRYLRIPRKGYTRENILTEQWADANIEGFVISQTLGGNQVNNDESFRMGGGSFGGGGARGEF